MHPIKEESPGVLAPKVQSPSLGVLTPKAQSPSSGDPDIQASSPGVLNPDSPTAGPTTEGPAVLIPIEGDFVGADLSPHAVAFLFRMLEVPADLPESPYQAEDETAAKEIAELDEWVMGPERVGNPKLIIFTPPQMPMEGMSRSASRGAWVAKAVSVRLKTKYAARLRSMCLHYRDAGMLAPNCRGYLDLVAALEGRKLKLEGDVEGAAPEGASPPPIPLNPSLPPVCLNCTKVLGNAGRENMVWNSTKGHFGYACDSPECREAIMRQGQLMPPAKERRPPLNPDLPRVCLRCKKPVAGVEGDMVWSTLDGHIGFVCSNPECHEGLARA